jgi:hypothetical protein
VVRAETTGDWSGLALELVTTPVGTAFGVPGCDLWLSASALPLANGASVATWADASGLGGSVTAAGTAQPTYCLTGSAGLDHQPTVQLDGNDVLSGGSLLSYGGKTGFTLFAVIEHDRTLGNTNGDIIARDGSGNRGFRLSIGNGRPFIQVATSASGRAQRDTLRANGMGMPMLIRARYNGPIGELSLWVNGVLDNGALQTPVPATVGNNGPALNVGGSGFGYRMKGHVGDVLAFGRALTDAECATIEAALIDQYGLYVLEETAISPDLNDRQAVMTDGVSEYTMDTLKVTRRSSAWAVQAQNTAPATGLTGINHLSDGFYRGGSLYTALTDYPSTGATRYIGVYDAGTLARTAAVSIGSRQPSGLCYDGDRDLIWAVDHTTGTPIVLHQYDPATLAYIGTLATDFPVATQAQGITYRDGYLWVSFGNDAPTNGLLAQFDPITGAHRPIYRRYTSGEAEGLDYTQAQLRWLIDDGSTEAVHLFTVTAP